MIGVWTGLCQERLSLVRGFDIQRRIQPGAGENAGRIHSTVHAMSAADLEGYQVRFIQDLDTEISESIKSGITIFCQKGSPMGDDSPDRLLIWRYGTMVDRKSV